MADSTEALEGLSYRDVQAKLKELGQPAKGYVTRSCKAKAARSSTSIWRAELHWDDNARTCIH